MIVERDHVIRKKACKGKELTRQGTRKRKKERDKEIKREREREREKERRRSNGGKKKGEGNNLKGETRPRTRITLVSSKSFCTFISESASSGFWK